MNEQDKRLIGFDKDGKSYFISEQEEITRLKQENEQLKEENYQLQKSCQICENFIDGIPCKPLRDKDYDLQNVINALEEINNNLAEILATIEEEGKPNRSIADTIWCKNIPCCTLWELVEGMQSKINEVLDER